MWMMIQGNIIKIINKFTYKPKKTIKFMAKNIFIVCQLMETMERKIHVVSFKEQKISTRFEHTENSSRRF